MTDIEQKENASSSIEAKIKMMYAVLSLFMAVLCLLVFVMTTYTALSSRLFNSGGILSELYYPFHFGYLISSVFFTLTAFLLWNKPNKVNQLKIVKKYHKTFILFAFFGLLLIMFFSFPVETTCGASVSEISDPCSINTTEYSYY
jgi:small-conductance mechanosensitive channel